MRVPASHPLAQKAIAQLCAGPRDRRGDKAFALIAGEAKPGKRKNKYGNKRVKHGGVWFDSQHELNRWLQLKMLERGHRIEQLERQVEYTLGGEPPIIYRADFRYRDAVTGEVVVEDAKCEATAREKSYQLKKRLMRTAHNIEIREV